MSEQEQVSEVGLLKLRKSPHQRNYSTRNDPWQGFIYSIETPSGKRVRVRQKFQDIYSDNHETLVEVNSGARIEKILYLVNNKEAGKALHELREINPAQFYKQFSEINALEKTENALLVYTDALCTSGVAIVFLEPSPRYIEFEIR